MIQLNGKILCVASLVLVMVGCSSSNEPVDPELETGAPAADSATSTDETVPVAGFAAVARAFQANALSVGEAMVVDCQTLAAASLAFLDNPTPELQRDAQLAWHQCYEQWQRFSLFHQVAFTPADQDDLERSRSLINIRPFQPGYVDALPDYPYTGLVHETGMALTLDSLLEQHQRMDLESPALGFPVVETLLWQSDIENFWLDDGSDSDVTSRRQEYLELATDYLLRQLEQAYSRWSGRSRFASLAERAQKRIVLTSLDRQVRQDILELAFPAEAPDEPAWHHPSLVAGQGQRHLLGRLAGLEQLTLSADEAPAAFLSWVDRSDLALSADRLSDHLTDAVAAISALPENAPAGDPDADVWQAAVAAVTVLADDISRLGEQTLPAQGAQ